ncbi:hypothetical protein POV27_03380 [Aureisphaera galaxeae]|uniref:hypothetical protein n=1 Tax=Aureisphaera galaxeae TaxID=1538023 RepID=UPI0023508861|nr:hypothetical protein [Aureisphaera galaxeae]MDC8003076.1 hypothetical protein [Aureisphaera galaxeae]
MNNYFFILITLLLIVGCSGDDNSSDEGSCLSDQGEIILNYRITSSNSDRTPINTFLLTSDGTQFDRLLDEEENVVSEFEYDANGRLVSAFGFLNDSWLIYPDGTYNYSFEYEGDQISSMTGAYEVDGETFSEIINFQYEGNVIIGIDLDYPEDIFRLRLELDNEGKLLKRESYREEQDSPLGTFIYTREFMEYGSSGRLRSSESRIFRYFPISGDLQELFEGYRYSYNYTNEIGNPLHEASNNVYLNFWMAPEPFVNGLCRYNFAGQFSDVFQTNWSVWNVYSTNASYGNGFKEENLKVFCNQLPANSLYPSRRYVEFNYE